MALPPEQPGVKQIPFASVLTPDVPPTPGLSLAPLLGLQLLQGHGHPGQCGKGQPREGLLVELRRL